MGGKSARSKIEKSDDNNDKNCISTHKRDGNYAYNRINDTDNNIYADCEDHDIDISNRDDHDSRNSSNVRMIEMK